MLDKKLLLLVLALGAMLWAVSIPLLYVFYPPARTAGEFGGMFGAVDALFSGLALAGVVYALLLQNFEIRSTQRMLEESIRANELAARIAAYGWLLQEGDNALLRYERWEAASELKRYSGAKSTVRKNMKHYVRELKALERALGERPIALGSRVQRPLEMQNHQPEK